MHALLTINGAALQEGINDLIPLLFPFKHVGGRAVYSYQNASNTEIVDILPEKASVDYPYENYPDEFDIRDYILDGPVTLALDTFASLVPKGIDTKLEDRVIVLIPPHEEFGVSLWGEEGTSNNVMCVFYIDTNNKKICCETQGFE